jgi:hypothetical protein
VSDPTPRRGEELPEDHPLAQAPEMVRLGDCPSDVPAEVLDDLADFHGLPDDADSSFVEGLIEPLPDDVELV